MFLYRRGGIPAPGGMMGMAGPFAAMAPMPHYAMGSSNPIAEPPKIRKEFPETWLWEDFTDAGYEDKNGQNIWEHLLN